MASVDELLAAVQAGNLPDVRRALDQDPSLLTARNGQGLSPFLAALYTRRQDVASLLLEKGLQPDLFEAAAAGDADRIEKHLAAEPGSLNATSQDGWTAVHLAAFFGRTEALSALLNHGADVLAWSGNGLHNQPLHAAVAGRSVPAVELLLHRGAEVNSRQHGGYTPLQGAAANGQLELVKLLLHHGANPALANDAGGTAASLAMEKNFSEVAALLAAERPI